MSLQQRIGMEFRLQPAGRATKPRASDRLKPELHAETRGSCERRRFSALIVFTEETFGW